VVLRGCHTTDTGHIRIAGLGRRFVADALDGLALMALVWTLNQGKPAQGRRDELALLGLDGLYTVGFMAAAGQTPGQRAMGIQVVDHGSGLAPAWNRVIIRWLALSARHVPRLLRKPRVPADIKALEELTTEVARLRRDNSGDGQRLSDELLAVYERLAIKPSKGIGFVALTMLLEGLLGVITLRDPLRRGLHDRLARTVVVDATSGHATRR
jgi:uncharacterized RDD family membrane protein YckC